MKIKSFGNALCKSKIHVFCMICSFSINVTNYVRSVEKVQGIKIACLEEISLLKNWINKKRIKENIKFYGNCEYSKYLKDL